MPSRLKKHLQTNWAIITAFIVIFVLSVFLRLQKLDFLNIWGDEAFTVVQAQRNISDLIQISIKDTGLPLFPLLLSGWIKLFGDSEIAIRSLPAIFDIASLVLVYFISRSFLGKWEAVGAMLLYSTNMVAILFAREARSYSLLAFFGLLACFGVIKFLEAYNLKSIYLFGITIALAASMSLYSHNLGIFIIIAVFSVFGVQLLQNIYSQSILYFNQKQHTKNKLLEIWDSNKQFYLSRLSVIGLTLLLSLPGLLVILEQSKKVQSGFWLQFNPLESPIFTLLDLTTGLHLITWKSPDFFDILLIIITLFGFIIGSVSVVIKPTVIQQRLPIIFFWVGFAGMFALSFRSPVMYVRYASFLNPFLVIAVALGIGSVLRNTKLRLVAILIITILNFKTYNNYFINDSSLKPHYREVVSQINSTKKSSDKVLHASISAYFGIKQYAKSSFTAPIYDPNKTSPYFSGTAQTEETDYLRNDNDYLIYDRIWLITQDKSTTPKFLSDKYTVISGQEYAGNLKLELWEKSIY